MTKTRAIILPLKGFTLAEVLVTLAIVGVIASMTIPTLLQNLNDAQYKTGYKKAFSVASQAWLRALYENALVARTGWNDIPNNEINFDAFSNYFSKTKSCTNGNSGQCWASGEMVWDGTAPGVNAHAFIDASGMSWAIDQVIGGSNCGLILVDVNGLKVPNKYGKDRFVLVTTTDDGVISTAGIPTRILPDVDYTAAYSLRCPSGSCWYTSWLMQ